MELPQIEAVLQKLGLAPGPGPARLKPRIPGTAVQVGPDRVSAVRIIPAAGGKKGNAPLPLLAAFREMDLPLGLVTPSLTRPNFSEPAPVARVVTAVLAEVAPRESRLSVVLPDNVARVSILTFNRMPATRREVMDLIRFRLQKVLPFRIEEAALDFQLLSDGAAEPAFLVALIQRPILFQYERLFDVQERHAGLVALESFNLANLAARGGDGGSGVTGDRALVNVAGGYLTVLFSREGVLSFYRCKQLADEERATPGRFHAAIRRELASCAAFYREHLSGAGLAQATLRVVEGDVQGVLGMAQEELACPVRMLAPGQAVQLPAGSDPADPRWQRLAPAMGAALGRRP